MRKTVSLIIFAAFLLTAMPAGFAEPSTDGARPQKVIQKVVQTEKTLGEKVVITALQYKGVPYKFGGASPKAFDCSGLVWFVFNQHDKKLPRTADKQFEVGKKVGQKDLKPGDVVFFTTYEKGPSHCGIFVGDGKFIHASSKRGVIVAPLAETYWQQRYLGARRMI